MFPPSPAGKNFEGTADGLLKREEGETFLDACLSEEGFAENKLSGGEIQRCRIVRALLSAKEIYVFDEPSPQMDRLSESLSLILCGFWDSFFINSPSFLKKGVDKPYKMCGASRP